MKRLLLVPILAPLGTLLYCMIFENRGIGRIYADDWLWGSAIFSFWITLALYTPNIIKLLIFIGSMLWDLAYIKYTSWSAMRGIVKAKKLKDLGVYSEEEFTSKVDRLKRDL
jgi:hypothetical protein